MYEYSSIMTYVRKSIHKGRGIIKDDETTDAVIFIADFIFGDEVI